MLRRKFVPPLAFECCESLKGVVTLVTNNFRGVIADGVLSNRITIKLTDPLSCIFKLGEPNATESGNTLKYNLIECTLIERCGCLCVNQPNDVKPHRHTRFRHGRQRSNCFSLVSRHIARNSKLRMYRVAVVLGDQPDERIET